MAPAINDDLVRKNVEKCPLGNLTWKMDQKSDGNMLEIIQIGEFADRCEILGESSKSILLHEKIFSAD